MGNMAVVGEVLGEFERQLTEDSQRIIADVQTRYSESARISAHKLKGAAGIFSANAISGVAAEIECLAHNNRLGDVEPLIAQLLNEAKRCLEYMPTAKAQLAAMAVQHMRR